MKDFLNKIKKFPAGKLLGHLLLGFLAGAATAIKGGSPTNTAVQVGVASAITSGVAFFATPEKSQPAQDQAAE